MTPLETNLERTVVEALVASGWIEGDRARVQPERALVPDDLFAWLMDAHPAQWARLARDHGDALGERLTAALDKALEEGNSPDVLRQGFSFFGETIELACFPPPNENNPANVARAAKNRLVVTRQCPIAPGGNMTVDLMFSLNGLPLATVELKHGPNGQHAADAVRQYKERPTHLPIFRWPCRAVVHFAVDEREAWMTTRFEGNGTRFVPFNQGTAEGGMGNPPATDGYSTGYLWRDVWTRESFLRLLHRYVHHLELLVERGGRAETERRLLFPRWHQRDAVEAVVRDVEQRGVGQRYLIEHSAGSGKSNTIAWLAWQLADLHGPDGALFDKVVVVTDRTVLDNQLARTLQQMTPKTAQVCHVRERVERAHSDPSHGIEDRVTGGGALVKALDDPSVRLVIVTVQTFLRAPELLDDREERSFAVLLDEAHSGVGEKTDAAMSRAFGADLADDYLYAYATRRQHPNQSLFAFTATPREETLMLYGTLDPDTQTRRPFHRYRMRQAIEEGFILDVLAGYVRYDSYFKLRGCGVDDPEVDRQTATAAIMREVSKDPKVTEVKCRVIVRHYLTHVRHMLGGEARAMVVAPSREAAARYFAALKIELAASGHPEVGVLVAFSGPLHDAEREHPVTEASLNGFSEAKLPAQFASGANRILVVANKYQTGFDQPLLMAMYIDRRLEGVQAVQTLSRLNRPCGPDKKVFALDFVNTTEVIDGFRRFYDGTWLVDAPTLDAVQGLREELDAAGVYTEDEVLEVARLSLTPIAAGQEHLQQERIAALISWAVARHARLDADAQASFGAGLQEFLRLYGLLAQVVAAPNTELEARAVYFAWLIDALPSPGAPRRIVDMRGRITVEAFRLSPSAWAVRVAEGDEEGAAPGELTLTTRTATGAPADATLLLSELLERLNTRYGVGASAHDRESIERVLAELLKDTGMLDALRHAADARDLAHDGEVQKVIRRSFRGLGEEGLAGRFASGNDDLRREVMEIVLQIAKRQTPLEPAP